MTDIIKVRSEKVKKSNDDWQCILKEEILYNDLGEEKALRSLENDCIVYLLS